LVHSSAITMHGPINISLVSSIYQSVRCHNAEHRDIRIKSIRA